MVLAVADLLSECVKSEALLHIDRDMPEGEERGRVDSFRGPCPNQLPPPSWERGDGGGGDIRCFDEGHSPARRGS